LKKIILITLFLTAFTQAQDFDTFIGIEAGSTRIQFDQSGSEAGGDYGLRFGFIKDTGRVYLSANRANMDTLSLNNYALNFDAITPRAYRFNDSFAVRGLLGFHLGFTQLKPDNVSDDEGAMAGAKLGVFLDFPADISLEVGLKSTWPALDLATESVKNYQNGYLAFNYTF